MDSWHKKTLSRYFLFALLCMVATALPGPSLVHAEVSTSTLRFVSLALRDHLPTPDEAKDFYLATDKKSHLLNLTDKWLVSEAHRQRMNRFFSDRFGSTPYLFLYENSFSLESFNPDAKDPNAPADLTADDRDTFYLKSSVKPTCSRGGAFAKTQKLKVWWSDTPVSLCSSAVSEDIIFDGGRSRCADPFSATGLQSADCGCGKQGILCIPSSLKKSQQYSVYREVTERGVYAYENNLSWLDLWGGKDFYGNRLLLHYYLLSDKVLIKGDIPTNEDFTALELLPLTENRWQPYPDGLLTERSGVVTAPAFMKRFNNFRSRIRALSENLLCQDIDSSLNTSGIVTFVNPSLTDFDRSHGEKADCASCHYALDNFGSTLLGWNDQGHFFGYNQRWKWQPPSQKGHVFGADGEGPQFLMDSLINRSAKFVPCMAKQVWEDFTGASFDALEPGEQNRLIAAASHGPKSALLAVVKSEVFLNLRSTSNAAPKSQQKVDFTTEVMPILTKGCAGSSCHREGKARPSSVFLGQEERFKKASIDRIASGSMPPPSSALKITADERDTLVRFLGNQLD